MPQQYLQGLGYLTLTQDSYYAGPPDKEDPIYLIKQKDVFTYLNDYNYLIAFNLWHKFHTGMGFPFAGGWAEQPWWMVEVISMFENAYNLERQVKHEKETGKNSNKPTNSNLKTLSG